MRNKVLQSELREYKKGGYAYLNALRDKGIAFAQPNANQARIDELRDELRAKGAQFKNAGASIVWGWQSKACVECTGNNGSETFSTTFKCHRDCYFCFNYNVADYDKFVREGCPWREGLEDAERRYGHDGLAVIGLTGGEPLLYGEFFELAQEIHDRRFRWGMTSNGTLISREVARRLHETGMGTISISVDGLPETHDRLRGVQKNCRYHRQALWCPHVEMGRPYRWCHLWYFHVL